MIEAVVINKAKLIRDFKKANPEASYEEIAKAMGCKTQYVYTVLYKASHPKAPKPPKPTITERQMAKGQEILRKEIDNLHNQITRLKLHNEMLQSMLKVQEFDLMHRHGSSI